MVGEKAEERVKIRMLEEAQRRKMQTEDGKIVKDWKKLREFFTTRSSRRDLKDMYACAIGVFKSSPGWMQDQTEAILREMGWEYDSTTIMSKGKKMGNGFVEKMISRKRSNLRKSIRKCCYQGKSRYKLQIVRPEHERYDENKKYIRRKPGYTSPIDTSDATSDHAEEDSDSGNELSESDESKGKKVNATVRF